MKKRLFAFSLVFMLCFVNVHEVYADAGSLVIGGSAIAGIGAGVIAGPAVVAVFCAMMAFGMNVELTQASEEAGMTKTEFLKNKIQEYCNEAQISANTFNNYVLDQAQVFQNGAISLTDQAGRTIQRFCNWLFESESVQSGLSASIWDKEYIYSENGVFMDGTTGFRVHDGTGCYAAQFLVNGYYECFFFRDRDLGRFWMDCYRNGVLTQASHPPVETETTFYTYQSTGWILTSDSQISFIPFNGEYETIDEIFDLFGTSAISQDVITGDKNIYDTSKNVLDPVDNETIVINPNITIPVPVDKDVTIDVNEYLDIVQDMIDGLRDDVITAIDDATGVPITIEFDPTQDWDPTIEKEDDTEVPDDEDKTPIVDDDTIPSDFDVDPLKFDLKGFFPFCLPFDVADMIGMLQADPVAPSYTVDWDLPFIEQNLTFTVDLEPYDTVAETCRKMEILLFCVGLAVVTRSIFIRS